MTQQRIAASIIAIAAVLTTTAPAKDFAKERAQVLALGKLTEAPAPHPAEGFKSDDGLEALYFEALPWKGKPTRVFSWIGVPENAKGKVPGVVLVHGGGGTAFVEWVKKWNAHGYAAISIAVEGQTDRRPAGNPRGPWQRHEFGGPARSGIYGDSAEPLADQWMYHAVADTILANSLLRAHPRVDPNKIGVMGISWGGVITSTVMGIDGRFVFAIPTYGCGSLADVPNQYGRALGNNDLYRKVWDPMVRMEHAGMPTLWLSWTGDKHFPLDALHRCYTGMSGPHQLALLPKMGHGHAPGWNPPDSYAFADSALKTRLPWCLQAGLSIDDPTVSVNFLSHKAIDGAVLTSTTDEGFTGARTWVETPATIRKDGENAITATAKLPPGTTAWFINLRSGKLVASSEYREMK